MFNAESLKSQSLNDLSVTLKNHHSLDMSKQSLHERFNNHAVIFLKNALEKLLQQQLNLKSHLPELKGINRMLIKDSVCFQIDPSLAQDYPGSGGAGSKASVRIQFEYDLKRGIINDLSLSAFNDQDSKNSITTLDLMNKNDLIIRDLAYMGLDVLKGIAKHSAYYLCRLNPIVKLYEKTGDDYVELNFSHIHSELKRRNMTMIEKSVFIGQTDKLPTRLIIHLMPEDEVNKRLRKARYHANKKGRELTAQYIARAHFNLFITNAKIETIPAKNVWSLYRLRWQIELMFKIWKSICDIEKVKKVKKHRLECYIYSKLILIVLGWQILWNVAQHLYRMEGKAISFYKAFKTFITIKLIEIRNIFFLCEGDLVTFMINFYELSKKHHLLEKKKDQPHSLDLLINCLEI